MVNNISSVSYKINIQVLDFILNNYRKYNLLIDDDFEHPLTKKQKLTTSEKKELESFFFLSKKTLEQNILGLAVLFRNISNFYIPIRLDFRGRLNCMTEYLNYQGSELAKALLLFSKGEKVYKTDITAINFLKIFGANCFGNKLDKASFLDRIKWVEDNIENIKNFDNGILISKAENKSLFISFCFEFNNYLNSLEYDLSYFITHLPIQLDASCNGFQHLTFLIGELALSEELNLNKSKWSDKPKDFYSFIALKVKDFFIKELCNNKDLSTEELESYKKLANLNIYRPIYKKVIMTWRYNVSSYSMVNYFKEEFYIEKDKYILKIDNNIIFKEIDFQILRKALLSVLLNDFPRLKSFINYLKDIAKYLIN